MAKRMAKGIKNPVLGAKVVVEKAEQAAKSAQVMEAEARMEAAEQALWMASSVAEVQQARVSWDVAKAALEAAKAAQQ